MIRDIHEVCMLFENIIHFEKKKKKSGAAATVAVMTFLFACLQNANIIRFLWHELEHHNSNFTIPD